MSLLRDKTGGEISAILKVSKSAWREDANVEQLRPFKHHRVALFPTSFSVPLNTDFGGDYHGNSRTIIASKHLGQLY